MVLGNPVNFLLKQAAIFAINNRTVYKQWILQCPQRFHLLCRLCYDIFHTEMLGLNVRQSHLVFQYLWQTLTMGILKLQLVSWYISINKKILSFKNNRLFSWLLWKQRLPTKPIIIWDLLRASNIPVSEYTDWVQSRFTWLHFGNYFLCPLKSVNSYFRVWVHLKWCLHTLFI